MILIISSDLIFISGLYSPEKIPLKNIEALNNSLLYIPKLLTSRPI